MWSEEQVNDAAHVLLSGSETGAIEKVTSTNDKDKKEYYLVVGEVTYTDPLYLKALDKLVSDGKLKQESDKDDRITYKLSLDVKQSSTR